MNLFSGLLPSRKPLSLSDRQSECVEDGFIWALNCIGSFAPPPIRAWVANRQTAFVDETDVRATEFASSAEVIWARLGMTSRLGEIESTRVLDSTLLVSAHLITLSEHRPPSWWAGTAKSAQLLALVLGLGFVFTEQNLIHSPLAHQGKLLSSAETGYALALISEYSGVEPKNALTATNEKVRESYRAGQAYLSRNHDLRDDMHALTEDHERLMARR